MKMYRLADLNDLSVGHIFQDVLEGQYLYLGGLGFSKPGSRSHTNDGPDGKDFHIHQDCELFLIVQGKGQIEVDLEKYPVKTGDIIIIEPGEDHHLISSESDPIITLWCHAGPERHKNQLIEK